MRKIIPLALLAILALVELPFARPAFAVNPNTLVKGTGPAVYYVAKDGRRHVFPNQKTFDSWFPKPPAITRLSEAELAAIPLGKNITIKPGSGLVKITTDPKVYAISRYGVLHWVTSESLARRLYGSSWNKSITDVPDAFFSDYLVGAPLNPGTSYSPASERMAASDIQKNMPDENTTSDGWMTVDQKRRAEELTSVFESGTPAFDYSVVENLGDGRGYTSGRIGFTTATGDAYEAVRRYTERNAQNALAPYLPRLKELDDKEDGSIVGLEGYPQAWAKAAQDPVFRRIQDEINDQTYYAPAMKVADSLGVKNALTRAVIYDTIIQHGGGDSEDSLSAIVRRTNAAAGGSPATGINEKKWLYAFLETRKEDLLNARDEATRAVWAQSVGRVDVFKAIADTGNYGLEGPIVIDATMFQGTVA